jgi:hypothetical protein
MATLESGGPAGIRTLDPRLSTLIVPKAYTAMRDCVLILVIRTFSSQVQTTRCSRLRAHPVLALGGIWFFCLPISAAQLFAQHSCTVEADLHGTIADLRDSAIALAFPTCCFELCIAQGEIDEHNIEP